MGGRLLSESVSPLRSLIVLDTEGASGIAGMTGSAGNSTPGCKYAVCLASGGGIAGSDFSVLADFFEEAFVFFLLLAIRASWHSMQKMPCVVRA